MTLGPAVKPKAADLPPEWSRCLEKDRRGFWSHRDPPHRLRYDPDAWEQAAATLEDNARRAAPDPEPFVPDIAGY